FDDITTLDEYYLPRAEREILVEHAAAIALSVPAGADLVELGSGSAHKTRLVIEALLARQDRLCFLPIDVSRSALESSAAARLADYAGLEIDAIVGTYESGLAELRARPRRPRLVLWLGSNVGNFDRAGAGAFLGALATQLASADRVLVGF